MIISNDDLIDVENSLNMSDLESLTQDSFAEIESLEKELGIVQLCDMSSSSITSTIVDSPAELHEFSLRRTNVEYSFELAVAESERESLQDDLDSLRCKYEDMERALVECKEANFNLNTLNLKLTTEKEELQKQIKMVTRERDELIGKKYVKDHLSVFVHSNNDGIRDSNHGDNGSNQSTSDVLVEKILREELIKQRRKFEDLEFKYAEAKSSLARSMQAQEDILMTKEQAEIERNQDRAARLYLEKERDAYKAAYEATLKQFEKSKSVKKLSLRSPLK